MYLKPLVRTALSLQVAVLAFSADATAIAKIKGTNASVEYDTALFRECKTSVEAKVTNKDMEGEMPWAIAPRHYMFTFVINPLDKYPRYNEIRIIPIHDLNKPGFKKDYGDLYATVTDLSSILAKRPARFELGTTIPEWNLVDSSQTIHSKIKYLDFKTHNGIFFISQETQESDGNPINSNETYCSYEGISKDKHWFIYLELQISNSALPKDADAANAVVRDPQQNYLKVAERLLDSLDPMSFKPTIPQIERLLSSIQFP